MYFEKFPVLQYTNFENVGNSYVLATDILKRIAFREILKDDATYFMEYIIRDGETPESLAYTIYGDTDLHWIILLFNNIIHPYYDWPMSQNTLDKFIDKKYPGKTFFVSSYENSPSPIFKPFTEYTTVFKTSDINEVGEENTDNEGNPYHQNYVRGLIESWDPLYQRMQISNVNGTGDFLENDILGFVDSDGNLVRARLERLVDISGEAVHHFEYDTTRPSVGNEYDYIGNTGDYIALDPLSTPPVAGSSLGNEPLGSTGAAGGGVDGVVNFHETNLGRYMGMTSDDATAPANQYDNVISNRMYEERLNDKKRKIRLLRPRYVPEIVNEFNTLLKEDSPSTLN